MSAVALAELQILLVDDHAVVREGLKRVLNSAWNRWALTEAATGFQALEILRRERFDLALVDLSLPGMPGLDLLQRIKAEFSDVRVLVLSMHTEAQYAVRAFKAGANGYLTKDAAAEELVNAVRKVAAGGAYVTESLAGQLVQSLNGHSDLPLHRLLTDREFEVLQRIAAGQRLTEIAETLHLSAKTVSTHKTRMQEKLQVSSTAELVRYAMENHLVGSSQF